jgi:hypothetical protein
VIVVAIGAAFGLGWFFATQVGGSKGSVNPNNTGAGATAASAPHGTVRLQLDAGDLTLVPDAGLHLKPMPTLDPDTLYRDSLDGGPTPPP